MGKGLVVNNKTKEETFMKVVELQAGSDFMWDANLNLGYRWTETFSTTFGYRYLDVDYEDGTFLYDVSQDGLTL